jgi:hypothetical protein
LSFSTMTPWGTMQRASRFIGPCKIN